MSRVSSTPSGGDKRMPAEVLGRGAFLGKDQGFFCLFVFLFFHDYKLLKVLGLYFHPLVVLGPAALSRLLTPKKGTGLFSSYT